MTKDIKESFIRYLWADWDRTFARWPPAAVPRRPGPRRPGSGSAGARGESRPESRSLEISGEIYEIYVCTHDTHTHTAQTC